MNLPPLPPALTKFLGTLHVSGEPNPQRDWLVLMSLFLIALAASIILSTFFFLDVVTNEPDTADATNVGTPDTKDFDAVQEAARVRAEEAARYEGEYRFVDPSR